MYYPLLLAVALQYRPIDPEMADAATYITLFTAIIKVKLARETITLPLIASRIPSPKI